MRKQLLIILALLFVISATSCGSQKEPSQDAEISVDSTDLVAIPDLNDVEESDAKSILAALGLVPSVTYQYSNSFEEGRVTSCNPKSGEKVEKGTKVTIIVSKGAKTVQSKDSYMCWTNIGDSKDVWEFYNPYVEDGILYYEVYNLTFGTDMEWRDRYDEGYASGTASINDSFDKVVPAHVQYSTRTAKAGQSQSCTISVPLTDLNVTRPTDMYFRIGIKVGGEERDLRFSISMTW